MLNWLKGFGNGLVTLQCPTCGAKLRVARGGGFTCEHCGNTHVLGGASELPATYQPQMRDWLRVGDYAVLVHEVLEEQVAHKRVVYVNVEYRNDGSKEALSCRRGQWMLFDQEGYSYETEAANTSLYEGREKPFFGAERFLNPGTRARGWLAFKVRPGAALERLQFFTGYLSTKATDIPLREG